MNEIELGVRQNLPQFMLLVLVNGFVGAMAGTERTILSAIAEQEFLLAAGTAILSFIVVFGLSKALATGYVAGMWLQAFAIGVLAIASDFPGFASGVIVLLRIRE